MESIHSNSSKEALSLIAELLGNVGSKGYDNSANLRKT